MIPESQVEDIISRNDLVDVINEYTHLARRGSGYMGLCPFHREKTPSFSVHEGKQIFKCFGCGKGGNVVHFIMLAEGLDYRSALEFLANRVGIEIETTRSRGSSTTKLRQDIMSVNKEAARFFFRNLIDNKIAQKYCVDRGIDVKTIKKFGIGFAPDAWSALREHLKAQGVSEELLLKAGLILQGKENSTYDRFRNRLMFPIFDVLGNVIAFGGRVLDDSMPKYLNSPETVLYTKGNHLYALNFARKSESKRVFIVEGYMDCIALNQRGITYSVASLGTALTDNQAKLLKKYFDEVIISYDADTAGQNATIRGMEILQKHGFRVKVLELPKGDDPDDYIRKYGRDKFFELADGAKTFVEYQVSLIEGRWSPKQLDTRIEFVKEVVELLAKIENRVERDMYSKWVSREYDLSEETLQMQVENRIKGQKVNLDNLYVIKRAAVRADTKAIELKDENLTKRDRNEKMLILLMSEEVQVLRRVRKEINSDLFTEKNRRLYESLLKREERGESIGSESVLRDADIEDAAVISEILSEWLTPPDIYKACKEIIIKLRNAKYEERLAEIYEVLKDENLDMEEKIKLTNEIKKILEEKRADI